MCCNCKWSSLVINSILLIKSFLIKEDKYFHFNYDEERRIHWRSFVAALMTVLMELFITAVGQFFYWFALMFGETNLNTVSLDLLFNK